MRFVHPQLLWLIPALLAGGGLLFVVSTRVARRRMALFGPPERLARLLVSWEPRRRHLKFVMVLGALCFFVLALARPMTGPRKQDAERSGAEFFIALDVSKSMLVRDVEPNRLEAVKASLAEWIRTRQGDRIGLVVAAGDAFVQAPLTSDTSTLAQVLETSGPFSVSRGGSNLEGAILTAQAAFEKLDTKHRILVLVSDGEGLEGNVLEAARRARAESGMTIFTVGVGSEEGGPVPEATRGGEDFRKPPRGFIRDEYGTTARSQIDERTLRAIASAGGGTYQRFQPDGDTWNTLYAQSIGPLARKVEIVDWNDYSDLFQIPLFAAILLLAAEMMISTRRRNPPRPRLAVILPEEGAAPVASRMRGRAVSLFLVWGMTALPANASPDIKDAERLIREGQASAVAKAFWEAAQRSPGDAYPIYNYGIAAYAAGDYKAAIAAFSEASASGDEKLRRLALTQLGNAEYRLGRSLDGEGNPKGALVAWERAVNTYNAALAEGGERMAEHNLGVASNDLEAGLVKVAEMEIKAGLANAHIHQKINSFQSGLDRYEKVLELNSKNAGAHTRRKEVASLLSDALRQLARSQRDEARRISEIDRTRAKERLNLAAAETYQRAVAADPENTDLAAEFAAFRKEVAEELVAQAETHLAEADRLTPKPNGLKEFALQGAVKQLKEAATAADKALGFEPENRRAKEIAAAAQAQLGSVFEQRADSSQKRGDAVVERGGREDGAAAAYQAAMEDYQRSLEAAPDSTSVPGKLEAVQEKLAASLAAVGANEMELAAKTTSGEEGLKQSIGHLEKAVPTLAQAESLAPGKNNAAALGEKATAELTALRGQLDNSLADKGASDAKGKGKGSDATDGASGAEGGDPPFPEGGTQQTGPRFGGGKQLLNFSDVRGGSEREGQFVDKSRKEVYKDW